MGLLIALRWRWSLPRIWVIFHLQMPYIMLVFKVRSPMSEELNLVTWVDGWTWAVVEYSLVVGSFFYPTWFAFWQLVLLLCFWQINSQLLHSLRHWKTLWQKHLQEETRIRSLREVVEMIPWTKVDCSASRCNLVIWIVHSWWKLLCSQKKTGVTSAPAQNLDNIFRWVFLDTSSRFQRFQSIPSHDMIIMENAFHRFQLIQ